MTVRRRRPGRPAAVVACVLAALGATLPAAATARGFAPSAARAPVVASPAAVAPHADGAAPPAVAAPRAAAAITRPGAEVAIEDERILLSQPDRAPDVVARWKALGVEAVRIHARWGEIAPAAGARRPPRGFHPASPGDRRYDWAALDRAVALLGDRGLKVQLTVTGPGPLWASARPALGRPGWRPRPAAFAAFARAVARRYRGRIARYLVWNEPNIAGWLTPQNRCRGGRGHRVCTPVSPHLYRRLVRAAVPVVHRADPGSVVLIGELAPIGERATSESSTVPPLPFLRAMACVDDRYRPVRTGPCAGFRPAMGDAFGHHPHGKRVGPTQPSANPDWAKLGDLPRLLRVLDRLTRASRIRAPGGRFDLYFTEFGYQTSPPDHAAGITVARQAQWLQTAAFIAWRNPRIRSVTHYQWEDEPVRWRGPGLLAYAGWQSGLLYVNGRPKPALSAFTAPLVVERAARAPDARLWGQVRPGGTHAVTIERLTGGAWQPVTTLRTAEDGSFRDTLAVRMGDRLRVAWPEAEAEAPSRPEAATAPGRPAAAAPDPRAAANAPGPAADAAQAPLRLGHSGTVVVPAASKRTALAAATRFPPAARSAAAAIMAAS